MTHELQSSNRNGSPARRGSFRGAGSLRAAGSIRAAGSPRAAGSLRPIDRAARGLGWLSIGLGAAELAFPGRIARTLGISGQERILRAYGAREVVSGIGLLAVGDDLPWIGARVAGDALDIGTLARALGSDNRQRRNARWALGAVLGVTALDVLVGQRLIAERAKSQDEERPADYSDRSGFPKPIEQMRGAARHLVAPRGG